jgi:hypothetical protein
VAAAAAIEPVTTPLPITSWIRLAAAVVCLVTPGMLHAADGVRPSPPASATDGRDARRRELVDVALARSDRLWQEIGRADPGPGLSCRELFSSALAICEARRHADRLPRLFEIATRMQERDPAKHGYGNFRWYWRHAEVTDPNAVEFCSYDMHLIWRLHRDWLPVPARESLRQILDHAVDGCQRHRVRPSYTNIAILNAANLIVLGELLGRADAADEGYRRLVDMAADTWRFGLHEYCSPTYYAIDIQGLSIIERFAVRDEGRDLARALLELVWTDIALNWFPAAGRLAGTHSRTYDALRGLGGLQQDLRWEGWVDVPPSRSTEVLHVAQGNWSPPERLLELARTRFPRLVRQSWGPRPAEFRTHWLLEDVTLGCSGASYGNHDAPLTFDLPGPLGGVRGSFMPDGREDPYGREKYATGSAGHPKALHIKPFWAGAQRDADAVGLVVYRDADLVAEHAVNLQSHIVIPRDVDGLWLRGARLDRLRATADAPVRVPVEMGDPLVIRKGSAAVGMRVVWSRAQDGGPAEAAIVDDGNDLGALRLTVEHRRDPATAQAAAAVWVRVGGGFGSDEAFDAWRDAFERSPPARVDATADRIHLAVPGRSGPVAITAHAPFADDGVVDLEPAPSRAVLELDGKEIGRPLFASLEPFASFAAAISSARTIAVPPKGHVRIEAESGFILPRMEVGDGGAGLKYVWQPDGGSKSTSGCVVWRLRVPRAGRYGLWGRVLAPDGTRDSLHLAVGDATNRVIVEGDWHMPRSANWRWVPVTRGAARDAWPLDLPAGEVQLTISSREAGTKLDALWLSSASDGPAPNDP